MKDMAPSPTAFVAALLLVTVTNLMDEVHSIQYKSGKTYPDYCSTQQQQLSREIPELNTNSPLLSLNETMKLLHVTTVIRHGDRTPWGRHTCWETYLDKGEDTAEWDCSLSSLSAAPATIAIEELNTQDLEYGETLKSPSKQTEISYLSGANPSFMFEKRYDANFSPTHSTHFPENLGDHLGGTCQVGQLTLRGFEQQRYNGRLLRNAYVKYDKQVLNSNKDPDMILFDFDEEEDETQYGQRVYDDPSVYFRSDDDQRTIMSGQALLGEMFGDIMAHHLNLDANKHNPVIRVHTSDRNRDFLAPNEEICPRLPQVEHEAKQSQEWIEKFETSEEARIMKKFADEYLSGWWRYADADVAMDCFMTTACSDRTLPYALDVDQSGSDQNLIDKYRSGLVDRWVQFHTDRESFIYEYNSYEYSKIVTNPIWNDILSGLLVFADADKHEMAKAWPDLREPSKFALYSAHDSTIMALLASLGHGVWDGHVWPAYASMFNIEIYQLDLGPVESDHKWELDEMFPTKTAFRLVYNGQVLDHNIAGCPDEEELCDIDMLIVHVFRFSNITDWEDVCKVKSFVDQDDQVVIKDEDDNVLTVHRRSGNAAATVFLLILVAFLFSCTGAFVMYVYLTRYNSVKTAGVEQSLSLNTGNDIELTTAPDAAVTNSQGYGLTPQNDAVIT
jgi:hypothetical protein